MSDYIDRSKDINADAMLTENETVTVVLKAREPYSASEILNIVVIDPQNREYTWEKNLSVSAVRERNGALIDTEDYLSFTPKVSGAHHLKISNADFQTDIDLVSGMTNPYDKPFFILTLSASFVIMIAGLFSLRMGAIIKLIKSRNLLVNEILRFCLGISISLIIVHNVVGIECRFFINVG